jgi:hypothetical protein
MPAKINPGQPSSNAVGEAAGKARFDKKRHFATQSVDKHAGA